MKSWLVRHAWQMAAVVILIIYVFFVINFLPLPGAITETPALPNYMPYSGQYMTLEENVSDSQNMTYFVAGTWRFFHPTITIQPTILLRLNAITQPYVNFYGKIRNFTLVAYQSENFTGEFPLSEGSNGFSFQIIQTMGDITGQYDIGPQILQAVSPSYELSFFVSQTTLVLTIILGIPAIIYGVKEFRELGRKKPSSE